MIGEINVLEEEMDAGMDIGHLTRRKTRVLWTSDKDKYEDKTMHCVWATRIVRHWGIGGRRGTENKI